jgi:hypothetical protein
LQILRILMERSGEIVTREDLRQKICVRRFGNPIPSWILTTGSITRSSACGKPWETRRDAPFYRDSAATDVGTSYLIHPQGQSPES